MKRVFVPLALFLLVYAMVLHWPMGMGFKADDYPAIAYARDAGRVLHDFAGPQYDLLFFIFYRPLVTLSLFVDFLLYGTHAFAYLLENVVAAGLSAVTMLAIAMRMLGAGRGGLFGVSLGLLWLSHPVLPVSLTWVVGRVDSHVVLPMLLAVYFHLRYRRGGKLWPVWLFVVLALLVKEAAFGLPLLLLGFDALDERDCVRRPRGVQGLRFCAWPYLLLLPLVLLFRWVFLGTPLGGYGFWASKGVDPLGTVEGLWSSLAGNLWPGEGVPLLLRVLVLSLCVGGLLHWGVQRRGRLLGVALCGAGVFGPLAQVLPDMVGFGNERYAYFASAFILAIWVGLAVRYAAPRWGVGVPGVHVPPQTLVLALLPLLIFLPEQARERAKARAHDRFNQRLVHALETCAAELPPGEPIILGGHAELANHPQRFLWGLGSVLKAPFHSEDREVLSLRKLHPKADVPTGDAAARGLPAWVEVQAEATMLRVPPSAARRQAPVFGFDGTLRAEHIDRMREQPTSLALGVGSAYDGRVLVMTSVGSFLCVLQPRSPGRLALFDLLASNVTPGVPGVPLPAFLLLWNAGDLAKGSPIRVQWMEKDAVAYRDLILSREFLQELHHALR